MYIKVIDEPSGMYSLQLYKNGEFLCNGGVSGRNTPIRLVLPTPIVLSEIEWFPNGEIRLVEGRAVVKLTGV